MKGAFVCRLGQTVARRSKMVDPNGAIAAREKYQLRCLHLSKPRKQPGNSTALIKRCCFLNHGTCA